jgi:transposase
MLKKPTSPQTALEIVTLESLVPPGHLLREIEAVIDFPSSTIWWRGFTARRMAGRRCPRGQRLHAKVPHGHWKTMTFLAALRCDKITAPCVMDGPINGRSFRAYVEQFLIPTLKPGDVVILDNLGSHKGQAVREAIRKAGAKLFFLPPYSPDLKPIEQVFAKLKTLLRKAAERTIETT